MNQQSTGIDESETSVKSLGQPSFRKNANDVSCMNNDGVLCANSLS